MITDKDTNFVYFSSLIREKPQYKTFWKGLEKILKENRISYGFIEGTRNIWCRDYMPVQVLKHKFVRFRYFPDYLIDYDHIAELTIQNEITLDFDPQIIQSRLILDGGNIVHSENKVILTDKVFRDNKNLLRNTVEKELEKLFETDQIYYIPQQPYDISGHADGMVRFVDDHVVLVSDFKEERPTWKKRYQNALKKTGCDLIPFPSIYHEEKNEYGDLTAKGVYINFALIGNFILMPQFGDKIKDDEALDIANEYFPESKIIPIDCNDIAWEGGVLNCCTWNVGLNSIL